MISQLLSGEEGARGSFQVFLISKVEGQAKCIPEAGERTAHRQGARPVCCYLGLIPGPLYSSLNLTSSDPGVSTEHSWCSPKSFRYSSRTKQHKPTPLFLAFLAEGDS